MSSWSKGPGPDRNPSPPSPTAANTPLSLQIEGPRARVLRGGQPLSRGAFLQALAEEPQVRAFLTQHLRELPHPAVFWECPVQGGPAAPLAMEWVSLKAPELRSNHAPFAAQLKEQSGPILTFSNLSGDATLVVPRPAPGWDAPHLLAFLRSAPDTLCDSLWVAVGRAGLAQRGPFFLSTAGMGVAWLHVRLDARPKYYRHAPYREGDPG